MEEEICEMWSKSNDRNVGPVGAEATYRYIESYG